MIYFGSPNRRQTQNTHFELTLHVSQSPVTPLCTETAEVWVLLFLTHSRNDFIHQTLSVRSGPPGRGMSFEPGPEFIHFTPSTKRVEKTLVLTSGDSGIMTLEKRIFIGHMSRYRLRSSVSNRYLSAVRPVKSRLANV